MIRRCLAAGVGVLVLTGLASTLSVTPAAAETKHVCIIASPDRSGPGWDAYCVAAPLPAIP